MQVAPLIFIVVRKLLHLSSDKQSGKCSIRL